MGKAGRAACIFTPMALSLASFVCILLINLGGYSKGSTTLNNMHFFEVNFSNFTSNSSSSELSTLLETARTDGDISDFYHINLWNYCNGTSNGTVTYCSPRVRNFWFNPVSVWNIEGILNQTASTAAAGSSLASTISNNITSLEDSVLDKSTVNALKAYQTASKWMFAAYFASLWVLLATVIIGIFAVCTRFLGFVTWLSSINFWLTSLVSQVATVLVAGASITSTILFTALLAALKTTLSGHNVKLTLSTHTLAVTWLATVFSVAATLFWLFSACCCSGKSNPHHRSNRGPPAQDFAPAAAAAGLFGRRHHSKNAEKTADYHAVDSPYASGGAGAGLDADTVPLTQVAAPHGATAYSHGHYRDQSADVGAGGGGGGYAHGYGHAGGEADEYYGGNDGHSKHVAFEPYRHN
ncbi:hypothetical protein MBLNU459_g4042t1 [Dothideomycetes sp. NU459]